MISLKKAIDFHGHLGPYLVLGLLIGEFALKKLKCKKYFGLKVVVYGATKKPKSCLVDGLQLATGATYGKGNIKKINNRTIKIEVKNLLNNKKVILGFKKNLIKRLNSLNGHKASEEFARKLLSKQYKELFDYNFKF